MAFTKQHSEENRSMKEVAPRLVEEAGFDPTVSFDGFDKFKVHFRQTAASVSVELGKLFPDVDKQRVEMQAISALRRAYGAWVNKGRPSPSHMTLAQDDTESTTDAAWFIEVSDGES